MHSASSRSCDRTAFLLAFLPSIAVLAIGCSRGGDPSPEPARAGVLPSRTTRPAPAPAPAPSPAAEEKPAADRERACRDEIVGACLEHLKSIARQPSIVEAVAEANRSNEESPEEILRKDKLWRQAVDPQDPLIRPYLENPCSVLLRELQRDHPEYAELFVMDAKGCIVGESNRTSDYWQGDEAKWTRSFNGGQGQVFVDEIEYDDSTQSYLVQVSLPVVTAEGGTIGAMTVGVQARRSR